MALRDAVVDEISKVVVGREREAELLLVSLLSRGSIILEGIPGVSKTTLAKAFANCLGLQFKRIQFTPDMLPLDIVGGFIYDVKEREFQFRRGPVFTNILLADEINRAPPKVQSALLEAMQEKQVTVEGHTELLPSPFMVIATQNPIEFQGVYPLPEGQLDRFLMKVVFEYPEPAALTKIIARNLNEVDLSEVKRVVGNDALASAFTSVEAVKVSDELLSYISAVGQELEKDDRVGLGASPRAMVHLARSARALAYVKGRSYVTPDDIKQLSLAVLVHRVRLDQSALLGATATDISMVIRDAFDKVVPPR